MFVLDVGCGTGSISKDMAKIVGSSRKVIVGLSKNIMNGLKTKLFL